MYNTLKPVAVRTVWTVCEHLDVDVLCVSVVVSGVISGSCRRVYVLSLCATTSCQSAVAVCSVWWDSTTFSTEISRQYK